MRLAFHNDPIAGAPLPVVPGDLEIFEKTQVK
jgi:hypothetical protein